MPPATDAPDRPWRPVPGPTDPEHFFAAQARNRRATWRLSALCILGVALMGIPMSVAISPIVYAAVIVANDLVNLLVPDRRDGHRRGGEAAAGDAARRHRGQRRSDRLVAR
ncbi:MAG: hypothetical protein H0V43_12075 [Gemmatimonadales bacterium]|nr:hypothetical protein [Gemmatimonadales bacterium]MBA3553272.1 hypothetical protein [Gemmatimonadales bacterium]